jgi:hypothetical protein
MNLSNIKTAIDWNNIFILDEFIDKVDSSYYIDLSSLSKSIRHKLKSSIFFKIDLTGKTILNKYNVDTVDSEQLMVVSNYFEYLNNPYKYNEFKDKWEVQLSENTGLLLLKQMLDEDLQVIRKFIRNFSVDRFSDSFYFLCPLTLNLTNLTRLSLKECAFPLLIMLKIGEHLKKLKMLKLYLVSLVGLSKQELSPEDVYLPRNLEELSFECCDVFNMFSVPNTLSLIHDGLYSEQEELRHLQGFKIPSLKKLTIGFDNDNELILRFLKSNSQIEELVISSYNMVQNISDQISISSSLSKIMIYPEGVFPYISQNDNLVIPRFKYIRDLRLKFNYIDDPIANHQNFIQYFPNLSQLSLNLDDLNLDNFQLNEFLRVNLLSIYNLEKLNLELKESDSSNELTYFDLYNFTFDWANFVNIKCLILNMDTLPLSSISFNSLPHKIKVVKKKIKCKSTDSIYIEENPEIFKLWKTEFKGSYIYFKK